MLSETTTLDYSTASTRLDDPEPCLLLELAGPSLSTLLKSQAPGGLSIASGKIVTRQILLALDFLHRECGIYHLFLQPNNIILAVPSQEQALRFHMSPDPEPIDLRPQSLSIRVCDFGVSEYVNVKTRTWSWGPQDQAEYCFDCIAPEFLCGMDYFWNPDRLDTMDVWLLGCIVYEILTGEPLFDDEEFVREAYEDQNLLHQMLKVTSSSRVPPGRDGTTPAWLASTDLLDFPVHLDRGESLRERLAVHDWIPRDEIDEAVRFMKRCLQMDPMKRSRVGELLEDPWLK